ncbi:cation:proton antiporter [Streptomyces sp. NPDC059455]|uniref:cation:proton antiporter n=1 Tax=Streptomyces sp. NPDC059455 TaxID=3346837 RepID=UPI0036C92751
MMLSLAPVEPLPAQTLLLFLLQTGTLLGLAFLLGRLAQRLGLPSIVGELTAGVLLGPSVLAHTAPAASTWLFPHNTEQKHLLDAIGQLGVLLLVGFTGMHIDLKLARRHGRTAAAVSTTALLLPLGLGFLLGLALPADLKPSDVDPVIFASFIGVALSVSSIPIIGRVLVDMGLINRTVGQMILVVATVDDAVGWLLVSVVTALATTGIGPQEIATPLLHMAVLLLVTLTAGRWTVRRVMHWAGRSDSRGSTITAAVVLLVLSGAGAQALGFEALLGAFLCGILIGACDTGEQTARLQPLNAVVLAFLSPLFFALAGLRIDLTSLFHGTTALWALAVLAVAVASKFLGAIVGSRVGRLGRWEALAIGAGINARGVVQVVIAVVGVRLGLITTAMYSIIVLIAVITPIMAPPILKAAMKRVERMEEEMKRERRGHAVRDAREEPEEPVPSPRRD